MTLRPPVLIRQFMANNAVNSAHFSLAKLTINAPVTAGVRLP